jgi:DNA-directed RNA polymerase subunit F
MEEKKKWFQLNLINKADVARLLSEKVGRIISKELFYRKEDDKYRNRFSADEHAALEEIRKEFIEELRSHEPVINFKNADI